MRRTDQGGRWVFFASAERASPEQVLKRVRGASPHDIGNDKHGSSTLSWNVQHESLWPNALTIV